MNIYRILISLNNTSNYYSIIFITIYITKWSKTYVFSLNFSIILINTIFRILGITDISSYINTTISTINSTFYRNTIITIFKWNIRIYHNTCTIIIITFNNTIKICSINITMYSSTILIKTCVTSLDSSWHLNNTVFSIFITDISSYINTTIITFNSTFYRNTLITIFKLNIWTY